MFCRIFMDSKSPSSHNVFFVLFCFFNQKRHYSRSLKPSYESFVKFCSRDLEKYHSLNFWLYDNVRLKGYQIIKEKNARKIVPI